MESCKGKNQESFTEETYEDAAPESQESHKAGGAPGSWITLSTEQRFQREHHVPEEQTDGIWPWIQHPAHQ